MRRSVLPMMKRNGPMVAWIVDDTGLPKKGVHSGGVVRQHCGQVGKQEKCRVAVSLSLATEQASLPIAWRLYLPEIWAQDRKRRKETGIPREVAFATKPAIALQQIRKAVEEEVTKAPVLADAAYRNDSQFREALTEQVWSMSSVFRNPPPSGGLEKLRCPQSGGKGKGARQNCYAGTNNINQFP